MVMDDEEEEDVRLKPGSVVESSKASYVIIKLLGEGGFGAVYKVYDKKDDRKEYAMKVEKKLESRRHSKLKMEIAILKMVASERRESHFTSIIDRGKKETYFFLVMELVGQSLAALKMARPAKIFSISTGLGAGIQCLEACQDLHKYGFIHRDLKPANYAIGLAEKRRTVYILDFGIARKILNPKGELKAPRQTVRFKGTIRFASIACHKNIEMGPKDDCESWFYLLLDLIMPRGLLWKSVPDKNMVRKIKEEMRTIRREAAFHGVKCKTQLMSVMDYLDTLQYQDRVDYEYIYKLLELVGDTSSLQESSTEKSSAPITTENDTLKESPTERGARTAGGNIDLPYDWEIGDDPTQSMSGDEKPHAVKPKRKAKRKGVNVSPNRSQQAILKPDGVNVALAENLSKEKRASSDGKAQKSTSGGRMSKVSRKEKGFFAVAPPKRQVASRTRSAMGEPSSMSTGLTASRQVNTRRPARRSRPRRRKKQTSSSSSSQERSAGGRNVSGRGGKVTSQSTGTSGGRKPRTPRASCRFFTVFSPKRHTKSKSSTREHSTRSTARSTESRNLNVKRPVRQARDGRRKKCSSSSSSSDDHSACGKCFSKTGEEASTQSCRSAKMVKNTGKSLCSRSTNKQRKSGQRNTKQSVKKGDVSL